MLIIVNISANCYTNERQCFPFHYIEQQHAMCPSRKLHAYSNFPDNQAASEQYSICWPVKNKFNALRVRNIGKFWSRRLQTGVIAYTKLINAFSRFSRRVTLNGASCCVIAECNVYTTLRVKSRIYHTVSRLSCNVPPVLGLTITHKDTHQLTLTATRAEKIHTTTHRQNFAAGWQGHSFDSYREDHIVARFFSKSSRLRLKTIIDRQQLTHGLNLNGCLLSIDGNWHKLSLRVWKNSFTVEQC